jgi:vacuolar-type H+-ATPase subunit E/Vma4
VADATPGVTGADSNPDRIEREMEQTRESITAKVSALENQVLGTIQTATSTISDTVQAVKDTVTTAPTAVKETIQESVAAMKDSVKETFASVKDSVASFDLGACVGNHPAAALGASVAVGFVAGYVLFGDSRPLMARGFREPAPAGRPGTASHDHTPYGHAFSGPHAAPDRPGMFANLWAMVGGEVEQLAKQALSTALASLKQSVNEQVPRLVDGAVQNVADRVTGHNGATHGGHVAYNPTVAPAAGL